MKQNLTLIVSCTRQDDKTFCVGKLMERCERNLMQNQVMKYITKKESRLKTIIKKLILFSVCGLDVIKKKQSLIIY